MAVAITRSGKNQLVVESPVMPSAGILGYGKSYRDMVNLNKLGALVTNPVTYKQRFPANGVRVVPLDSGVLVHTGLPNPGLSKVIREYRDTWATLDIPIIVHLVATTLDEVSKCMEMIENVEEINAVELGLPDDITPEIAYEFTERVASMAEKPCLVRLPMYDAHIIAESVVEAGAGALVVAAPPRGTARDPQSGKLVGGRVYSPIVKATALRLVGSLARRIQNVPIIGAGGIHSPEDARDFIEAGATAVQVDSVTWVLPRMIEIIARDLGGLVLTREAGAMADEWFTGIGETDILGKNRTYRDALS